MKWIKELFGVDKPMIAMCHLQALPGDPGYDAKKGMDWVGSKARKDLLALQRGGVDAVMFSNESSLPYLTTVDTITVACMARVISELQDEVEIPYGVNVLWDPEASIDLAVATGASFVREIFTGVYASDKAGAAGTVLFDLKERDWSPELLEKLGIDLAWLPPTFEGTETTGTITPEAAAATGLRAGTPVVGGGGGGRPDMAQAGGTQPQHLEQALEKARVLIQNG